jgi:hypothetical protein
VPVAHYLQMFSSSRLGDGEGESWVLVPWFGLRSSKYSIFLKFFVSNINPKLARGPSPSERWVGRSLGFLVLFAWGQLPHLVYIILPNNLKFFNSFLLISIIPLLLISNVYLNRFDCAVQWSSSNAIPYLDSNWYVRRY